MTTTTDGRGCIPAPPAALFTYRSCVNLLHVGQDWCGVEKSTRAAVLKLLLRLQVNAFLKWSVRLSIARHTRFLMTATIQSTRDLCSAKHCCSAGKSILHICFQILRLPRRCWHRSDCMNYASCITSNAAHLLHCVACLGEPQPCDHTGLCFLECMQITTAPHFTGGTHQKRAIQQ